MKTNTTRRFALPMAALLAFGFTATAQTTSYNLNSIPIVGANNAAFGLNSMLLNTPAAQQNAAIGWAAMMNNVNGSANSAGGYAALANNNNGGGNSAFGAKAVDGTNGGSQNSGFGIKALTTNVTGGNNTGLGAYADVSAPNLTNATALGAFAVVNANNKVRFGNAGVTVVEGPVPYTVSDGRFKSNIREEVKGLDFIKKLRPVIYNVETQKLEEFLTKNMSEDARKNYMATDFGPSTKIRQSGFIAQEVELAAKEVGYDFNGVHTPEGDNDNYSLAYGQFVVPLVKAVQEQQQMIEDQKAVNANLQQQIADLQKQLQKTSAATGIEAQNGINSFSMGQNEPNPFTHETVIKYNLPETTGSASVNVYDLSGKQIASFPVTQKGNASLTLTAEKLAAGIYIYSIVADGKVVDSKRMIVSEK